MKTLIILIVAITLASCEKEPRPYIYQEEFRGKKILPPYKPIEVMGDTLQVKMPE
jgi:hypothetical protein